MERDYVRNPRKGRPSVRSSSSTPGANERRRFITLGALEMGTVLSGAGDEQIFRFRFRKTGPWCRIQNPIIAVVQA